MKTVGEKIAYYRKQKSMSQEMLAQCLGVSRQAISKWEKNISQPNSKHLYALSVIFGIQVEDLMEESRDCSYVMIIISIVLLMIYIISSLYLHIFSIGLCILLFVIIFPIQLLMHIYFKDCIKNENYSMIAGYDPTISYHQGSLKKLLEIIDYHQQIHTTLFVFIFVILSYQRLAEWVVGIVFVLYVVQFVGTILLCHYKMIPVLYQNEEDKINAKKALPLTVCFVLVLIMNIVSMIFAMEYKHIENNSGPALKLVFILIVSMGMAITGYFLGSKKNKAIAYVCFLLSFILYILMIV